MTGKEARRREKLSNSISTKVVFRKIVPYTVAEEPDEQEARSIPETIKPHTNDASNVCRAAVLHSIISNSSPARACPGLSAD